MRTKEEPRGVVQSQVRIPSLGNTYSTFTLTFHETCGLADEALGEVF